ncbi:MAG: aminotransferase class I/II-fold pyridoxal phosphate-dependent enzyme [Oscillospiraceae bacterium]|nr:aminotransferase class I/II-fold pyridoxal phosphate-dependent enzyme [Oscillospiraceae bacterium]
MEYKFLSSKYRNSAINAETSGDVPVEYDDLINLSIGDPDINTPQLIIDRAFRDACAGHTKYTASRGYPELRAAICDFYKNRYGMDVKDEEVFVSTAGSVAMYITMQAILDEGDEVIIIEPYFFPYPDQVKMAGGVPVFVKTSMENNFQIDFDNLEAAVTDRTKAIIINTPNNPTGICYTRDTLSQLSEFAHRHDLVVVADDIYTSFTFTEEKFVPICSFPGMKERTITINSFSKNFIMTGFRVGNIVAPDYIIRVIQNINENVVYTAPSISQRAALHGLHHFDEFEDDVVNVFRERVEYAHRRLSAIPWVDVLPVSGSFYIFPSIKKTGLTSSQFTKKLMDECHVRVIPGRAFGESGEYHIRISCTLGTDKLKEAFDRMEKMTF